MCLQQRVLEFIFLITETIINSPAEKTERKKIFLK